jgi:hypothetical protein
LRAICEGAESFRQRQQLRVQFGRIQLGGFQQDADRLQKVADIPQRCCL